jgi:hypothetical protein
VKPHIAVVALLALGLLGEACGNESDFKSLPVHQASAINEIPGGTSTTATAIRSWALVTTSPSGS